MSELAKLVDRFRSRCAMKGGCQDSRDPEKCAWCQCADELEAVLVRETVSDGWTQIRTSFYKELLAIATEKETNDPTK